MNDARRRRIRTAIKELREDTTDVEMVRGILEDVQSEEEDARDNTPESLQESDGYMVREESCDFLDDALGTLDSDDPGTFANVIETLLQIDGV